MLLAAYRGVMTAGEPLVRLILARRRARGKEDAVRFRERQGIASVPRPPGPLIWLHAASIGESVSLLPVIDIMEDTRPELSILVTTGTVTSARLLAERLPERAIHQYVPVDRPTWVRRFLDHWCPDVAVWCESEFWPNLILETHARGVPMVLVQGRVSERSLQGWQRVPKVIGQILGCFRAALAQSPADAERLAALGAREVAFVGNLKHAAPPLPCDPETLNGMRNATVDRPCWLAASTHAEEEALAGRVHVELKEQVPGLLTLIVPRHPERGDTITAMLRDAAGATATVVAQRSKCEALTPDADIYVADTIGELGLFYRLASVVFVGKSLAGSGGQNPLEPAHLDCAILFGPHMANFADIAERLIAVGAAHVVDNEAELKDAVAKRLKDNGLVTREAEAAKRIAVEASDVVEEVVSLLVAHLPPALTATEPTGQRAATHASGPAHAPA